MLISTMLACKSLSLQEHRAKWSSEIYRSEQNPLVTCWWNMFHMKCRLPQLMSSVGVMFPGSSQCYMNVAPSSARLFWSSANFLILIKAVLLSGMGHNGFEQILPSVKPNFLSLSHIEVSPKKAFSFAFFIVVWYEDGKLPVISITVCSQELHTNTEVKTTSTATLGITRARNICKSNYDLWKDHSLD